MHARLVFCLLLFITACSKTDRDYIDEFVESVTGEITAERVNHVVKTYIDLDTETFDVRTFGESRIYRPEDKQKLADDVQTRVPRFYGSVLKPMRKRIDIKDDQAYVELQILSRDAAGTFRYQLRKHQKRWLLSSLSLSN